MNVITAKNYSDMSQIAAHLLLKKIKENNQLTLGLATGGTPIETYNNLIQDFLENQTSYQHITTFNLDEYIGLDRSDQNSYYYYMKEHLFNHISIPSDQTHIPNGLTRNMHEECNRYEALITHHNGIDLQLLGLGSNGHIGFNEPGTAFDSKTHVVNLTNATRNANARFFSDISEVPKQAITMGIGTIMKSKEILLLVSGTRKSNAIMKLLKEDDIDPAFPASILRKHPNVTIVADEEAMERISPNDPIYHNS